MLARHRQRWPGVHAAARELDALLDNAAPGSAPACAQLRAIVQENLGSTPGGGGRFRAGRAVPSGALTLPADHRLDLVEVSALGALALLEAIGGHLHEAARLANSAVKLLEPAGRLRSSTRHSACSCAGAHPVAAGSPAQGRSAACGGSRGRPGMSPAVRAVRLTRAIQAMVLLSQRVGGPPPARRSRRRRSGVTRPAAAGART